MAIARKCDRCGRLYECYTDSENGANAIGIYCITEHGSITTVSQESRKDLCPRCMKEFNDFMKMKNLVAENEEFW